MPERNPNRIAKKRQKWLLRLVERERMRLEAPSGFIKEEMQFRNTYGGHYSEKRLDELWAMKEDQRKARIGDDFLEWTLDDISECYIEAFFECKISLTFERLKFMSKEERLSIIKKSNH